jgi:hypothetical protein
VAADFEGFFFPWTPFKVPVVFTAAAYPGVKADKAGTRIVLPRDMGDVSIDEPTKLFMHLLILGHEIGHLVHKHLHAANAQSVEDYLSLELWADWYGAKVMATLMTYGPRTTAIGHRLLPSRNMMDALDEVGAAVGLLVKSVYHPTSKRYPPPLERAGLTVCGLLSFLRKHLGNEQFDSRLYLHISLKIFRAPYVHELLLLAPESARFDDEPLRRAAEWHRQIQGDADAITPGFKPDVAEYLHTTFNQTADEIRASREERLEELREAGFDV